MNSNVAVATNTTIQHPNIFYFTDGAWSSINSLEYWNKGNIATTVNNNTVYKTIYSPSPTSYVEPKSAVFTGFTSSGGNSSGGFNVSGSFAKGWNFYCQPNFAGNTIIFSALGIRDSYSGRVNAITGGTIFGLGGSGLYWSAGPSGTSTYVRLIDFASDHVNPQNIDRRDYGVTLRSVSE